MTTGKRLTELFNYFNVKKNVKNKQEFCYLLGIDYTNFSKYTNDKINFNVNNDNVIKIESFGINIKWLLSGEGEMFIEEDYDKIRRENEELKAQIKKYLAGNDYYSQNNNGDIKKNHIPENINSKDVVFIDLMPFKASAGPGQEISQLEIFERLPVLKELIFKKGIQAIVARGESMTGISIFNGDIVFYEPECIQGDGLYIIRISTEVFIKRLIFDYISNKISIISENRLYPDEEKIRKVDNDSNIINIVGKVVGWIHKHPY